MIDKVKERRRDKDALRTEIINAGGIPAKNNMFHCPYHNDRTASSWIKQSREGFWYFRCFTCNMWLDVWDAESRNTGKDFKELVQEKVGELPSQQQRTYYKTIDEVVESLGAIEVEEINKYTNPDNGEIDLVTFRYLPRGENKKLFAQAYQSHRGFVKRRPPGLLPLFNRTRLKESDTIIFVEGEKVVRFLTKLGYTATTGSGGSSNLSHDFTPLAGKIVYLFADNDDAGKRYMEQVRDNLLALEPLPTVFVIPVETLDLPVGGDAVDLFERIKIEGGDENDCKDFIDSLIDDAKEANRLEGFETLLDDMREGRYRNLEIRDFPILTNEAMMLLNKRIGIIYGNAGFGKSLLIGKACDDLVLDGRKVARLQLEDELEQHLLRTFAQQSLRAELANPSYHLNNPLDSKLLYEQFKPTLDKVATSVISGEHEEWDDKKVLNWIEQQFKQGAELVVVDPISVIMTDKVWLTSHRLMWGTKKILANYPEGRVVFISHQNTEGEVSGGQAYKRFCHTLLVLNRYKKPKNVTIVNRYGEEESITMDASIGIAKTRYGKGNGLEIAVKLNPSSLCIDELGVVINEDKPQRALKPVGRDLDSENDSDVEL